MKQKCYGVGTSAYPQCGGKGITVCPEWHDFAAFYEWAMSTGYTDEMEIVREDANGNYEPSNCQWRPKSRHGNNALGNQKLTAFGETKSLTDWARDPRCSVSSAALYARLLRGWTNHEEIISTPNWIRRRK